MFYVLALIQFVKLFEFRTEVFLKGFSNYSIDLVRLQSTISHHHLTSHFTQLKAQSVQYLLLIQLNLIKTSPESRRIAHLNVWE